MRLIGGAIALALAGFATSVAFAGVPLPPLPTVSTPTLPSVTTTLPVKPPAPPPPPPAPAPVPPPPTVPLPPAPKPPKPPSPPQPVGTVTTQAPTVTTPKTSSSSTATGGVTGTRGTSSPSNGGTSSGGPAGAGAGSGSGSWSTAPTGSSSASGGSASAARTWIQVGNTKNHRTATIRFIAPSTTRAIVTVNQVFPTCVGVGHFALHAHAGANSFQLGSRVNRRLLRPGTYHVTVRARSGRLLRRMIVVVVTDPSPTSRQLAALRAANVCGASAQGTSSTADAAFAAAGTTNARLRAALRNPKKAVAGLVPARGENLHSGVLASTAEEAARAIQPLLVALLALAIILLGVASLPREAVPGARVHDTLARHRLELAAVGGAALVAVALAFLF